MKPRVFNLIILDESGSMEVIKNEAIMGVNETFQTIRSAREKYPDMEQFVSFVSFNTDAIKTIHDCVPAAEVRDITAEDYNPSCCTPLYDAIGQSISALRKKVADTDRVLVTVITDGYENASSEYRHNDIYKLVTELKEKGWTFAYIGAEHDVEQVAQDLNIDNHLRFSRNSISAQKAMHELQESEDAYYTCLYDIDPQIDMRHFFSKKNVDEE